ncbi:MAG: hypothetical protein KF891_08355 [Rhizobacter sp.]|nr:hypothetical protein [Rhizobacter sp.]
MKPSDNSNDRKPQTDTQRNAKSEAQDDRKVQGEGDYEAARRYDKSARDFAQSGRVGPAADKAAPEDAQEENELRRAEDIGRSRARGEDPGVSR